MARLNRVLVAQREEFVREAFRREPSIKANAVNTALAVAFAGAGKMRPGRLSALRTETISSITNRSAKRDSKSSEVSCLPQKMTSQDMGAILIHTTDAPAIEGALAQLRQYGLTQLRVDHAGDSYAVLTTAA